MLLLAENGDLYGFGQTPPFHASYRRHSRSRSFAQSLASSTTSSTSSSATSSAASSPKLSTTTLAASTPLSLASPTSLSEPSTSSFAPPKKIIGAPSGEITHVAAGKSYCAIVRNGQLYTWGNGARGVLGVGDEKDRSEPTLVSGFSNSDGSVDSVVSVECGWTHTAVVTASGKLYTFGNKQHGKLGYESSSSTATSLVQ
jgi:alpha-tubulin suppressor-like RCC1 family protein